MKTDTKNFKINGDETFEEIFQIKKSYILLNKYYISKNNKLHHIPIRDIRQSNLYNSAL